MITIVHTPGNNFSLSGNLGLVPKKFLSKCGIHDTYDHQISAKKWIYSKYLLGHNEFSIQLFLGINFRNFYQ